MKGNIYIVVDRKRNTIFVVFANEVETKALICKCIKKLWDQNIKFLLSSGNNNFISLLYDFVYLSVHQMKKRQRKFVIITSKPWTAPDSSTRNRIAYSS